MKLVYQEKWVPMQPLKLYFRNNVLAPLNILLKDGDIVSGKMSQGPNLHISKMAAIRTAKMLIAITQ